MLKPIKAILGFFFAMILAVLLGVLAWGSWQLYKNERQNRQFTEEGHRVTVHATGVKRDNRAWYDQFTNDAYVSFRYNDKNYEVRVKQDTAWISPGDKLEVWYHPGMDKFIHPERMTYFDGRRVESKLIRFTFINQWTNEKKWFVFSIVFFWLFLFMAITAVASLLPLAPVKLAARVLIIGLMLCFAGYFIYNTGKYYQYYSKLKANSTTNTVTVLDTDKVSLSRKSKWWFRYEATVQFNKGTMLIPIDEDDYDRLKPNDRLQVYYNSQLNDMMSVNYQQDHSNLLGCALVIIIVVVIGGRFFKRKRSVVTNNRL